MSLRSDRAHLYQLQGQAIVDVRVICIDVSFDHHIILLTRWNSTSRVVTWAMINDNTSAELQISLTNKFHALQELIECEVTLKFTGTKPKKKNLLHDFFNLFLVTWRPRPVNGSHLIWSTCCWPRQYHNTIMVGLLCRSCICISSFDDIISSWPTVSLKFCPQQNQQHMYNRVTYQCDIDVSH